MTKITIRTATHAPTIIPIVPQSKFKLKLEFTVTSALSTSIRPSTFAISKPKKGV